MDHPWYQLHILMDPPPHACEVCSHAPGFAPALPGYSHRTYPLRVQAEVFAEVALLERFAHSPHVTQLLSYGCNKDNAFLVMTAYAGSLAQWRKRQPADPRPCLRMYLAVFLEVVAAVQVVAFAFHAAALPLAAD